MNRQQQIAQMMNSPQFKQQFMQRMRGLNPSQILDQIASDPQAMQNEMIKNVMEKRKNHDTEGLTGLAENIFRENGRDYGEFEKGIKQQLGFN